jgi:dihydrofolate synthase / folylpolyglutamate synthase
MTYKETLQYLYQSLPMYQRVGGAAYKANLDNTIAICNLLDNPYKNFKSIHIGGTNGKGSTSHYIASVLQEAGYKVGLYTSPHLKDFRERIKINGKLISKNYVCQFVEKHKKDFEMIKPSFFEMTVGLAFEYFSNKKVDIAVIEVGLGGRLDSTNVIQPVLSVITNISFDHMALLGNTLEQIAFEKAGIIKPEIPIVIGEEDEQTKTVFLKKALQCNSKITFASNEFSVKISDKHLKNISLLEVKKHNNYFIKNLKNPLLGSYQLKNLLTVLASIDELRMLGFSINDTQIKNGIKNAIKNTSLAGRWQIISNKPLTIVDTGHNQAGLTYVLTQIKKTPHKHLHFVLGMVNDKDLTTILKMLPQKATYYFCKANIPRGLPAADLAKEASSLGLTGKVYKSVKAALKAAQQQAAKNDLVFVGGSTFTVAEVV